MASSYKYIFGPVPSRRLGRSLGIDLIPFKTCSFDCIYCQIGRTTNKTTTRDEYVPIDAVLEELNRKIKGRPKIDFLTFSGSGEPTLHSGLGKIIKAAKKNFKLPIAVITNGSLLFREDVQKDLLDADVVLPTLSTLNPIFFKKIHRPAAGLSLPKIIEGMTDFRTKYRGQIWLEFFVVKGINDRERHAAAFKSVLDRINPDKIQVNTSVRVPSEEYSLNARELSLRRLKNILGDNAELIAEFKGEKSEGGSLVSAENILNYLKRRPGTLEDIAAGLDVRAGAVRKVIDRLQKQGKISSRKWQDREVYCISKK
jgi:wyosine [tRNA(Phe)-imidazoG37] synthetase (radical SAM superfamily)